MSFLHSGFLGLQPEIDVQLSVVNPLVPEQQKSETNLLAMTIESLYSPPDNFVLTGPQFNYTAALPMPVSKEVSLSLPITQHFMAFSLSFC